MTINEESAADTEREEMPPYKRVIAGTIRMTGAMADEIITTLVDHARNAECAAELGMTETEWYQYVQQFEEQIRHHVRNLR